MKRYLLLLCVWLIVSMSMVQVVLAQELITSTPVRVNIPTEAAPVIEVVTTATVTRTPTQSAIMIEAKPDAGEVNVRADADIEAERLGTIRAGDYYPVLGRYFRWIQFQFDASPTGRAWVFDELVNIIGDENAIPNLNEQVLPTDDPAVLAATQTQAAVTQTPGGILTITAESRVLTLPDQSNLPETAEDSGGGVDVLPTFTYPPNVVAEAPTEVSVTPTTSPEEPPFAVPSDVPPIFPIVLLGAGGLLGLVVSTLRR